MSYRVLFRLPTGWMAQWSFWRGEVASVVRALPDDWKSVSGDIETVPGFAPEPDRVFQRECSSSGLMISSVERAFEVGAFNVTLVDGGTEPDFLGIFVEGKRPGFVNFRDVVCHSSSSFRNLRGLAVHYVRLGYRGCLTFRAKGTMLDMGPGDARAYCILNFPLRHDSDRERPGITLGWDERFGGSRKDIAPLVELCRKIGLKES